jgi:mannose-1-phosphate guanylyltransferase
LKYSKGWEIRIKALILAGGYGTRLRPLSCTRPKLLFPVAGKTMLEWILRNIYAEDFDEVILAVNHLADILKKRVGNKIDNININYSLEPEPLGTGGPIKKVEDKLKDIDNFLIANGDILTELNFKRMLESHSKKGALVTVALHKVSNPSRYGVVELDKEIRIKKFVEKPKKKLTSRWINAGIYLMNANVLKHIPADRKVSLEKEIFPKLSEKGKLYGFKLDGSWYDIGNIDAFKKANYDIIKRDSKQKPLLYKNINIEDTTKLKPPIIIQENASIGIFSTVGPNSLICQNSQIGNKAVIKDSIIFENVKIGNSVLIEDTIIGGNAEIGDNVKIGRNCIISDYVIIQDNITISKDVIVHPYKELENDVKNPGHVF